MCSYYCVLSQLLCCERKLFHSYQLSVSILYKIFTMCSNKLLITATAVTVNGGATGVATADTTDNNTTTVHSHLHFLLLLLSR
jgi:hypothetical protein